MSAERYILRYTFWIRGRASRFWALKVPEMDATSKKTHLKKKFNEFHKKNLVEKIFFLQAFSPNYQHFWFLKIEIINIEIINIFDFRFLEKSKMLIIPMLIISILRNKKCR